MTELKSLPPLIKDRTINGHYIYGKKEIIWDGKYIRCQHGKQCRNDRLCGKCLDIEPEEREWAQRAPEFHDTSIVHAEWVRRGHDCISCSTTVPLIYMDGKSIL